MPNWIKKLLRIRATFGGKHTPTIPRKFPRLKALDRRVAAAREISVCATGIYEQLTPEQRERAKNVDLHPINEVRHEPLARQAQLWGAKEALEKFPDVISDGEEIFNDIANQAISQVETLIESIKND
jgi:hypothetical protein